MASERSAGGARRWRKVRNELLSRGVNEKMQSLLEQAEPDPDRERMADFFCECAAPDCTDRIRISIAAYDEIHDRRDDFVVRPGHQVREIERVVESEAGYLVVRKSDLSAR